MDQLRIQLFGGVEVRSCDASLPSFPTKRAELLFAYLVLHRHRPVHRDVLCGQLWGDQRDALARKILRTELWRIRSVIEPRKEDRGTFLRVGGDQVGFTGPGEAWVDAWEFEECSARSPAGSDVDRLERAAALYRGDLLEGHYEEWCLLHRERLRVAYLNVLERLVRDQQRRGNWLEAIARGQELLRLDPLREHVHRTVMECHLAMGNRPSALRQYDACVRVLRQELDIAPIEQTTRMYRQILEGESTVPGPRSASAPARRRRLGGAVRDLAAEVDDALRAVRTLAARLERTSSALLGDQEAERGEPPSGGQPTRGAPRWREAGSRVPDPETLTDT
jgi:DNA-binding SARP family transcriptional activator